MDTRSHFELVGEFHDVFGHPQKQTPFLDCFEKEYRMVPFRISLLKEECDEFKNALYNTAFDDEKKLVEMGDALCDLAYFLFGTGHCLGIDIDDLLKGMNLSLSTPGRLSVSNVVNMNVLKTNHLMIESGLMRMDQYILWFSAAAGSQDFDGMRKNLGGLAHATYELGHSLNFNMDQMFREVHRSNMSKVCLTLEDAEVSVEFYKTEGRYKSPAIRTKGKYFVVYDSATTKILKNHKWNMPDLKQFF